MLVKRTTFRRAFQSVRVPEDRHHRFHYSESDNINCELYASFMTLGTGTRDYVLLEEGKTSNLTIVSVSHEEFLGPEYDRYVNVQTTGLDHHPKELLDLLEKHEYDVAPPKTD